MNGEKALSVKPAPLRVGLALLGILLLAAGALWLGGGPDAAVACEGARAEWSASDPPVNLTHVFCGEVKADGREEGAFSLYLLLPVGPSLLGASPSFASG